jgi:hypothetical protein
MPSGLWYKAVFSPAEGRPVFFELADRSRHLSTHVINGILTPEPVRPLILDALEKMTFG